MNRLRAVFCGQKKFMDEEEYERYWNQVLEERHTIPDPAGSPLHTQIHDENAPVPGCYRTIPAPTE